MIDRSEAPANHRVRPSGQGEGHLRAGAKNNNSATTGAPQHGADGVATIMNAAGVQVKHPSRAPGRTPAPEPGGRAYCWAGEVTISSTSHRSPERCMVRVTWSR